MWVQFSLFIWSVGPKNLIELVLPKTGSLPTAARNEEHAMSKVVPIMTTISNLHERTGMVVKQLVWFRVVRCPGVVMPLLCVCARTS